MKRPTLARFRQSAPDEIAGRHLDGTPFEMHTTDGAQLRGLVAGPPTATTTVVFCHCWTGRRQFWDAIAMRLTAEGVRVVTFDHRGHGASTSGDTAISIDLLSNDLSAVLDHLAIDKCVLVGHSEGGAIALHRATSGDRRVRGLVIVASSAAFLMPRLLVKAKSALVGMFRSERLRKRMHGRLGRSLVRPTLGFPASKTAVDRTLESFRATTPDVTADHFVAICDFDLRDQLPQIAAPTTVVVGKLDIVTPVWHARTIARGVPNAELVTLPRAGHMLPLERPTEVANAIAAFVVTAPSSSS